MPNQVQDPTLTAKIAEFQKRMDEKRKRETAEEAAAKRRKEFEEEMAKGGPRPPVSPPGFTGYPLRQPQPDDPEGGSK